MTSSYTSELPGDPETQNSLRQVSTPSSSPHRLGPDSVTWHCHYSDALLHELDVGLKSLLMPEELGAASRASLCTSLSLAQVLHTAPAYMFPTGQRSLVVPSQSHSK